MFDRQAKIALVLVCLLLLCARGGLLYAVRAFNLYLDKKPVELREDFSTVPSELGEWTRSGTSDEILTEEVVESLGTELYLGRLYHRGSGLNAQVIQLHVTYYTGMIDAVPHVPGRCFIAGGMLAKTMPEHYVLDIDRSGWGTDDIINRATGEPYRTTAVRDPLGRSQVVRLPVGDFVLRTQEFAMPDSTSFRIYAGYFFIANGRIAHTPEDVKLLAFKRSEEYAYYCKVQFSASGGPDYTAEEFTSTCSDFLEVLLPDLSRCLPDWSEIESRQAETTDEGDRA